MGTHSAWLPILTSIGRRISKKSGLILATLRKSGALATLYQALVINDILGFGAIFVLHIFRFDLAGKICAGEFKEEEADYPHSGEYLIS